MSMNDFAQRLEEILKNSPNYPYINNHITIPAIKFNTGGYIKTLPTVKEVIYHNPATIVYWSDGTKTVVKAQNESFDEEKGFAMAYLKKVFGKRNKYLKIIKGAVRQEKKDK